MPGTRRLALMNCLLHGMEGDAEAGPETESQVSREPVRDQLNLRFGPLSTDVADRIAQATPEQIKIWAGRLLSARTLDDVFADN